MSIDLPTPGMNQGHWDPLEHERTYYSHRLTGDRGYLVRREGKDCIRLDRPMHEIVRPFRTEEWNPDADRRPLLYAQIAQVAFEADKKLCMVLGQHSLGRREWLNLRDEERMAWISSGPPKGELARCRLFQAIMTALSPYASQP